MRRVIRSTKSSLGTLSTMLAGLLLLIAMPGVAESVPSEHRPYEGTINSRLVPLKECHYLFVTVTRSHHLPTFVDRNRTEVYHHCSEGGEPNPVITYEGVRYRPIGEALTVPLIGTRARRAAVIRMGYGCGTFNCQNIYLLTDQAFLPLFEEALQVRGSGGREPALDELGFDLMNPKSCPESKNGIGPCFQVADERPADTFDSLDLPFYGRIKRPSLLRVLQFQSGELVDVTHQSDTPQRLLDNASEPFAYHLGIGEWTWDEPSGVTFAEGELSYLLHRLLQRGIAGEGESALDDFWKHFENTDWEEPALMRSKAQTVIEQAEKRGWNRPYPEPLLKVDDYLVAF